MLPSETLLEREVEKRLRRPFVLSMASRPVEKFLLTAGELNCLRTLEGSPRREAWLRGRTALKRLLTRMGDDTDTSRLEFPHPRISLTHSRTLAVAMGTTDSRTIGVGADLELGSGPSAAGTHLFLTHCERLKLCQLTARNRLRLWTVKEALYKANPKNSESWFTDYVVQDPMGLTGSAVIRCNQGVALRYTSFAVARGYLTFAFCFRMENRACKT